MTRFLDRTKAHELRKQGKSYSQIKKELGISKSTLSQWLRKYPLSKEQIDVLQGKSVVRIEKYRQTMQRKRNDRFNISYENEKVKLMPLSKRDLYIAGLFLYWGEGTKGDNSTVSLNNTDPNVVKFFLLWLTDCLNVPKNSIRVTVHLYEDMEINDSLNYWSNTLGIQRSQFIKPYIKKSLRLSIDQKGFGHGTCGLYIYDIAVKTKIRASLKIIADNYLV
jgi:transposase-like protein